MHLCCLLVKVAHPRAKKNEAADAMRFHPAAQPAMLDLDRMENGYAAA